MEAINGLKLEVFIQENGIIRRNDTGLFLGRLDDISFEELLPKKTVTVDADELEHLLNCMDNQKFIYEQSENTQKEWQEIIDKANRKMRQVWIEQTKE